MVGTMARLITLKSHFASLEKFQGYISEDDYHTACHGITDKAMLTRLAEWLIAQNYRLVKGIGQQYQQEVMRKVKNPNVEDVKDTKDRTHKNKNKFQKSKKKEVESSFHLNKTIEEMQEFEDEFFPAWKKWKASLNTNLEFLAILASVDLTAQDFSNYEQAQRSVMQLIESYANEIPEDAYVPNTVLQSEFLKIDPEAKLPINQRITNAISRIFDPKVLAEIFSELYRGIQSGFDKNPAIPESQTPQTPAEALPSGTRMLEPELGPSGLETASIRVKPVRKAKMTKIATTVARIGYSNTDRMRVKFDNGTTISAYIAATPMQKAAGLEVFDSLDPTEGLLFPFEEEGSATFHMGSVQFPIDIVFLMDSPHGLEIGKIVSNIQPKSPDWWSYPTTSAVLELVGGACKKHDLKIGTVCAVSKRVEAAELSSEYRLDLPEYAGESDIFELFKLLSEYHEGQDDPIYAVQSRESRHNISLTEMHAIEDLLEDVSMGKYIPGWPSGQVAPADMPMGISEENEMADEQEQDMGIARSWLPEIREIISENSPVEEEF